MRMPLISSVIQLITDASGGGPRGLRALNCRLND
jgi:hypothetical protein